MKNRDIEKEIRERWFYEHLAEYSEQGKLKVLVWSKPKSWMYGTKYIFDGCNMYVSGDIGEAVFCFTEKADVHTFKDYNIDYFESKLRAYGEERRTFDPARAVKRLREWLKEMKEYPKEYDHDSMRELFQEARQCSSHSEWNYILHEHDDFISELDQDYWEWMPNCGDEIPWRIYGYLIGLQMASEQLKSAQALEG